MKRNEKPSPLTVDRRQLARLLGVSLRHITDLEGERVIIPLRRGSGGRASSYALEAVVPAYISHVTATPGSGAEREARRRRDMAQAQFTELKIAKEEGALVSREDVIFSGRAQVKAWTAKVKALPRQMVQAGIIPGGEEEERVAALLRQLMSEIATWQTIKELERAGSSRKKKATRKKKVIRKNS